MHSNGWGKTVLLTLGLTLLVGGLLFLLNQLEQSLKARQPKQQKIEQLKPPQKRVKNENGVRRFESEIDRGLVKFFPCEE